MSTIKLITRSKHSSAQPEQFFEPAGQQALIPFALLKPESSKGQLSRTRKADQWAARATLAGLAGLPQEQESYLFKGLALCPDHPLINHNLGNILLRNNKTAMALEHFQKALEINPRLGGSYLNAGVCQMNLRDFESAQKLFARARKLQPRNFQAWANHSLSLQRLGRHSEALKAMAEASRLAPENARLRQALQNLRSHR